MQISEVLHCAADNHLSIDFADVRPRTWRYSCDTLRDAIQKTYPDASNVEQEALRWRIKDGMVELGLDPESLNAFEDIPQGVERQGARYSWLKFCAMLAEEQGE